MHALVIDDSRAMRLILTRMLGELGFDVSEAPDGRAGLEQMESEPEPAVVIVDWNMPGMSGIEFIETVRGPPFNSKARLVMVTSESEVPQVVRALEAGADEYVMKPFTKGSILEKLQLLGIEV